MTVATKELLIHQRSTHYPYDHPHQREFVESAVKRIVVRAGRRGGKTIGLGIRAVERFLQGRRQLYGAPTLEQLDAFWVEVCTALAEPIQAGVFKKNETEHTIERPGTKQRIKAKTVWNADTLRGDSADDLYLDEWQLMNEDTWEVVGMPMLLDRNGDAVFIYTPPSLRSAGVSKAHDPRHAAKMFKMALKEMQNASNGTSPRWAAFHFASHDNPYISKDALSELIKDMSRQSYRQEILAEDDEIQLSWLVYRAFNEAVCKIRRFEIPKNWEVFSGHDFGPANPAALFFAQVKLPLPPGAPPYMRLNDLVCFKEYLPGAMSAPSHVNNFKGITAPWRVDNPDWRPIKSIGGNVTTEDDSRQLYKSHGWTILPPTITKVNPQIERVIGLMELNKVYSFDDNYNWNEELMNCLWEPDSEGRPTDKIKDEQKYHLCAAARYILSDFTPETVVKQEGGKSWYY